MFNVRLVLRFGNGLIQRIGRDDRIASRRGRASRAVTYAVTCDALGGTKGIAAIYDGFAHTFIPGAPYEPRLRNVLFGSLIDIVIVSAWCLVLMVHRYLLARTRGQNQSF